MTVWLWMVRSMRYYRLAPDLFCVSMNGLSKSHRIAGFGLAGWHYQVPKSIFKMYCEGLNMLSNIRLCSMFFPSRWFQTSLGGHQSVDELLLPGGRIYEQRSFIYKAINDIRSFCSQAEQGLCIFLNWSRNVNRWWWAVCFKFLKTRKNSASSWPWLQLEGSWSFRIVYLPRVDEYLSARKWLVSCNTGAN